jgi:hypothetical protein
MSYNDELGQDIGTAKVLRVTDKALLVRLEDHGDKEVWVPKSQIHEDSEVYDADHEGVLVVSEWFAKKAEL